jgi:hypothetical protein
LAWSTELEIEPPPVVTALGWDLSLSVGLLHNLGDLAA